MLVDELNAHYLLDRIPNEGTSALSDIVRSIVRSLYDIKIDDLEFQAQRSIAARARRFGKGAALLAPFGYFHPSEIISVITDNASRGRLSKNSNRCLYTYDFRPDGELALITFPSNATRTICEKAGNVKAYLTYELYDGSKEIVDVTLTKYDDNGLLEVMIQVVLFDNAKRIAHVYEEACRSHQLPRYCLWQHEYQRVLEVV